MQNVRSDFSFHSFSFCCICLVKMQYSVTHWRGQDDVGVLNLKEVINLCVACEFLAAQPKRTKLLLPALKALTAQSFDRGHWQGQTKNLFTKLTRKVLNTENETQTRHEKNITSKPQRVIIVSRSWICLNSDLWCIEFHSLPQAFDKKD